ncbi:unnamed protein product, partial [Tuber aestivum]
MGSYLYMYNARTGTAPSCVYGVRALPTGVRLCANLGIPVRYCRYCSTGIVPGLAKSTNSCALPIHSRREAGENAGSDGALDTVTRADISVMNAHTKDRYILNEANLPVCPLQNTCTSTLTPDWERVV